MILVLLAGIAAFVALALINDHEEARDASYPDFVKVINSDMHVYKVGDEIVFGPPSKRDLQKYCPYCHHNGVPDDGQLFAGYDCPECMHCHRKFGGK